MCFDDGLTERNCQCGVVCALRVREATSSLKKEVSHIPDMDAGVEAELVIVVTA